MVSRDAQRRLYSRNKGVCFGVLHGARIGEGREEKEEEEWKGKGGHYYITSRKARYRYQQHRGLVSSHLRVLLWVRTEPQRNKGEEERGSYDRISPRVLAFLEMIVDRRVRAKLFSLCCRIQRDKTRNFHGRPASPLIMRYASRKSGGRRESGWLASNGNENGCESNTLRRCLPPLALGSTVPRSCFSLSLSLSPCCWKRENSVSRI